LPNEYFDAFKKSIQKPVNPEQSKGPLTISERRQDTEMISDPRFTPDDRKKRADVSIRAPINLLAFR
jgi:hypothetical protein